MPVQSIASATLPKACVHHFPLRQLHLHQRSLSACSVRARPPKLSLQVSATSTANLSHDVAGSQQVIEMDEPFQPLTKARKKQKPSTAAATTKLDIDWQKAGKSTCYGAVAVAAGFALKALAVDVNSVAAIGATLAAGMRTSRQRVVSLLNSVQLHWTASDIKFALSRAK